MMLSYAMIFCLSYSILKHVLIYIWLSSSSGRGRSMDDQVLDLALMTNYSQSIFMWTVASCQYLHRFNIVWVGHPIHLLQIFIQVVLKFSKWVSKSSFSIYHRYVNWTIWIILFFLFISLFRKVIFSVEKDKNFFVRAN